MGTLIRIKSGIVFPCVPYIGAPAHGQRLRGSL